MQHVATASHANPMTPTKICHLWNLLSRVHVLNKMPDMARECKTLIKSNRNNKTIKEKNSYKKTTLWILWLRNPNHRQSPPLLDAQPSVFPHVAPSGQSRVSASFDLSSKQWLSSRQKSAKWSFAQRKKEVGIIERVSAFEILSIITFHRNTSASNPQREFRGSPNEEMLNNLLLPPKIYIKGDGQSTMIHMIHNSVLGSDKSSPLCQFHRWRHRYERPPEVNWRKDAGLRS